MTGKKSDTWMPFYVGDYLQATSRLTTEQHGAYVLILLDYWTNGPPPNDDGVLAQIARMTPAAWRKAKPALLGFFKVRDGKLIQKRVEKERVRADEITEERSRAGKIGAEKRWHSHKQSDGERIANATDLPLANEKQNDAPLQPPKELTHTSSLTTLRGADCFNEVCEAAGWRPASDSQRALNLSILDGWLASGCGLELVLRGIAQARRHDPSPTRSLKRFDSTIRGMATDKGIEPTVDATRLIESAAAGMRVSR